MTGQIIAILESRLGEQLAELIVRRGGKPLRAPALAELPDLDPRRFAEMIEQWQARPAKAVVFQTGVGTQALFKTADTLGLTDTLCALLACAVVVARGPKPAAALRARGVRVDLRASEPFTTSEVLAEMDPLPLEGERVIVQRYGAHNTELERGLRAKGAILTEIPVYRWALPTDTRPIANLIAALGRGEISSVVFTSASQVHNLFQFARSVGEAAALAAHLNATLVASIGPVCTAALVQHGVKAGLEARPPKLGPLVNALDEVLSGT